MKFTMEHTELTGNFSIFLNDLGGLSGINSWDILLKQCCIEGIEI